nr:MAG TPA: hypothetical protein [Caudoviricetes sp.]
MNYKPPVRNGRWYFYTYFQKLRRRKYKEEQHEEIIYRSANETRLERR